MNCINSINDGTRCFSGLAHQLKVAMSAESHNSLTPEFTPLYSKRMFEYLLKHVEKHVELKQVSFFFSQKTALQNHNL